MTEIMPVPRNSHITVLRPPSICQDIICFKSLLILYKDKVSLSIKLSPDGIFYIVFDWRQE